MSTKVLSSNRDETSTRIFACIQFAFKVKPACILFRSCKQIMKREKYVTIDILCSKGLRVELK